MVMYVHTYVCGVYIPVPNSVHRPVRYKQNRYQSSNRQSYLGIRYKYICIYIYIYICMHVYVQKFEKKGGFFTEIKPLAI